MPVGQLHHHLHGDGPARPIVLLHELGGSAGSWQWARPRLAERGPVLTVDLPGHGRSPLPAPGADLDAYAEEIAAVLSEVGWEDFDLVGVAFGGLVAPFLDRFLFDSSRRVVLSATPFRLSAEVAGYCRERAARVRDRGMEEVADASLANSFPAHLHGSPVQAEYRSMFVTNDPEGYAEASLALARLDNDVQRSNFDRMRGRAGLVCGAQDPLFPLPVVTELAEYLDVPGGPVVLPNAGHFPHVHDPRAFADAVTSLLDRARTGGR